MKIRTLLCLFFVILYNLHTANAYSFGRSSCDDCLSGGFCSLLTKWRCLTHPSDDTRIRYLNLSEENVEAKRARLPYPLIDYSGTTFYYLFKMEKVVLSMRLNGGEAHGISDIALHEFDSSNTLPEIQDWLEGISTDYATIVQPLHVYEVDTSDVVFTVSSLEYIERIDVHNVLENQDETLDVYQLDFVISDLTVDNRYVLTSLSDTTRVYVTVAQ